MKYRQRPGSLTEDPRRRKWKIAEIESLRRVGENLDLSEAQRKLLDEEIAAAVAAVALAMLIITYPCTNTDRPCNAFARPMPTIGILALALPHFAFMPCHGWQGLS